MNRTHSLKNCIWFIYIFILADGNHKYASPTSCQSCSRGRHLWSVGTASLKLFVINSKPDYLLLFCIELNCAMQKGENYHYGCHLSLVLKHQGYRLLYSFVVSAWLKQDSPPIMTIYRNIHWIFLSCQSERNRLNDAVNTGYKGLNTSWYSSLTDVLCKHLASQCTSCG